MNESEHVVSSKTLAVAVDNVILLKSEEVLSDVVKVAKVLRRFVCNVYSSRSSAVNVSELLWELFRTKSFEGEKLPPPPDETNHTENPDQIVHSPVTMDGSRVPMESCRL